MRVAAADAARVARWVRSARREAGAIDETRLFAALHTCAFRVSGIEPPLPASEQARWLENWKAIREYLVEQNIGLVYSLMTRFRSHAIERDELFSEGLLALSCAVERFDPWRGYRFSTYACSSILRALLRRCRREARLRLLSPVQHDEKLDIPQDEHDQAGIFIERLRHILDTNAGRLSPIECDVIKRRFPRDESPPRSYQEIGEAVGLSKERVRQIQNVALSKLRASLGADPVLK